MTAEAVPLAPPPSGWTVADLESLPDNGLRYELVDGVLRVMAPAAWRHNNVQLQLVVLLRAAAPSGFDAGQTVGIELAPDQLLIPDAAVLREVRRDDDRGNFPAALAALVAEVVSPSSRADDRFRKPAQYAQAGIPVYLRVELDPLHVVAYEIGADGLYEETARAEPGQELRLARPFPITFDPAALQR